MNNKKNQVIETARTLFSQYGYRKVSMDEIAKQSGVTKRTIYTYFKDKNDLIKFFLYEELGKMKEITNEIDKKDISFDEKIHETIMALMDYRMNSSLLMAFSKEKSQNSIDEECLEILNTSIEKEIKHKLEQAMKDGYIKEIDPEVVSFLIYKIYVALMFELDKPLDKKIVTESIMNILKAWLFK